ncbi:hypothetical protein A0H76_1525 [Hepatospora eriocheir]|uniref:Integrase zinc-binding domain-containing protein n=1 Tax=Hepatospora eriocheir TaxID=1081669 RepID=A0A1X0QKL9_9MICR|nr:hypothetical protein A0H76_1525 [Hepatospora eriocheir]
MHAGVSKLYNTIRRYYKMEKLKERIEKLSDECEICRVYKNRVVRHEIGKGSLQMNHVNEMISSDITGSFIK